MNRTKENEIIRQMLESLHGMSDGTITTTWRLLKLSGYDPDQFSFGELLALHSALFKAVGKEGIIPDMSSHDGKSEGLPFNLEFIVRKHE